MDLFRDLVAFCFGRQTIGPKVVVYVKHHLNPEGLKYFEKRWFPLVHSILKKQEGFVLFKHEKTKRDCVFLTLLFQDEETFGRWIAYPGHDDLVNDLDPFRSKDYWQLKKEKDWKWQTIKPKRSANSNRILREEL